MISIEELEKNVSFENSMEDLSELNPQRGVINDYTNLYNFYLKKKELAKERLNLSVVEKAHPEKNKFYHFKQIKPGEFSFYLTLDVFLDILYMESRVNFIQNVIDFRNHNFIYFNKTKSLITLNFYPCVSEDWCFDNIGFFDGIFSLLVGNDTKIHSHLSSPYLGLTDLYLACSYSTKILLYEGISSIKIDLRNFSSYAGNVKKAIYSFYKEKLSIIQESGLLTEEEISTLLSDEHNFVSIDNKTLMKRV